VNALVLFLAGGIGVMIVIGIASALIAAFGPGSPRGDCPDDDGCVPPVALPFSAGSPSPPNDLGFSFRYNAKTFSNISTSDNNRDITLTSGAKHWIVRVTGRPASESTPQSLLDDRISDFTSTYGDLERDPGSGNDSDNAPTYLPSQSIGHVHAIGGAYRSVSFSNGPTGDTPLIAIFAAGNGRVNIVMSVVVITDYYTYHQPADVTADDPCPGWKFVKCGRRAASLIVDTMQWP